VVTKLAGWAKKAGDRTFPLDRLNIGPRLTLCFAFIILAMLLGNAVLLWQFHRVSVQAERLSGVDQELIAVLQAHTNLMSFYERLDELAHSENTAGLMTEAELLRTALVEDSRRSRNALSRLPPDVELDPTLLPTLQAIQDSLPAELVAITALAKSKDWQAVRLRLANQVRPLESRTSALVENIDREVGEKRGEALIRIGEAQRRIFFIVPATAALTLAFAAFLGLAITRSITRPLRRLTEGSKALAGGDFSHRVPTAGKDEIAHLGNIFNDMIVRLQELYRELQRREDYLAEAQKLSHTGSFSWHVSSGEIYWSVETFRMFQYDPLTKPTLDLVMVRTHPEDRSFVRQVIERVSRERTAFDFEHRLLIPGGTVKYIRVIGRPSGIAHGGFQFVGAVMDVTAAKESRHALEKAYAEIQVLKDELQKENIVLLEEVARTSGRLEERERIARDLHDTLLQSFQGVLLRFQATTYLLPGRPDEARKTLETAIEQAAQAITECRDAVQGLRSSLAVTYDLASAIGTLGRELAGSEMNGNAAEFQLQVEGTPRNLHSILRDEVFRIAGEAVRNAFKHAQAKRIEVEIRYDEPQLQMRVRDDGKGIDAKLLNEGGRPGHYGLRGMHERADLMGGKLAVWSELDAGTEIDLRIPASRAYQTSSSRARSWLAEKLAGKDTKAES